MTGAAPTYLGVFGHTNIDYLARVRRLPGPDESMAFEGPVRALGGTAANIAVYAAALGTPVLLVSPVGDDFPREFEAQLRKHGVDLRHLQRIGGHPTPVCWIFTDDRERQLAFINQGAAQSPRAHRVEPRAVRAVEVVHLATGSPKHHLAASALAKREGKHVSFDPGQELSYVWTARSFRTMLGRSDTLFLNDAECKRALSYLSAQRPRDLLESVSELVLTHGRRGSEFMGPEGTVKAPAARPTRIVNTTGAGDAFRGGYYAAAWRGLPPLERLRWGNAAASFAVEAHSGQENVPTTRRLRMRLRPLQTPSVSS